MKGYFTRVLAIVSAKKLVYLGSAAAVLVGIGWMAFGGSSASEETMSVSRGEFLQQVSASGKVVPAREVELGFTTGGRIAQVNARVGDRVGQGAVIVAIDSGDIRANLLQREAALETEEAKLTALKQGSRPEEIAVAEADVQGDRAALVQADEAVFDAIKNAYTVAERAIRTDVYQFVSNPRSYSPQVNVTSTDSQSVIDLQGAIINVEGILAAWEKSALTLNAGNESIVKAQSNLGAVSKLLSIASVVLNHALPSSSVSQTSINGYVADINAARSSVNATLSALTSTVTAQKNATAQLDASLKNLALKKAGSVQADIDAQAARVRAAEADVANGRAQLSKTLIVAPFTGIVTDVDAKVGAIASSNSTQIKMIGADTYQIESFVPEINIALIKIDNAAAITLDAYGEEVTFVAHVVSIDPAETVRDGVSTYRVVLQFDAKDDRIRSGMTANIVVTAGERSNILAIPVGLIKEKNGKKYVQVKENNATAEREVTTGALSSSGQIEILFGLSEGEVLIVKSAE
ncbi:efflux RND transporter periplasmic adaptor subunit [Candidatus Kaiserbacteria bacterium]|nr:efflux RND transporter periplasmic adaptor subunit [Candidatus Kaiserbacteria bacterium]